MSIRDDMVQKVLGNPGRYSIEELKNAMQSGALPAYIVVPIIQDKVQQQKQMQASMLLQQPAPKDMPPIAQQVMQEAQMMQAAPGVEGLPSNLPQEYAHGGIVAFEGGGEVERYQTGRLVESEEQRRAREAYRAANPFLRESDELEDDPQARADRKAMVETLRKLRAAGMDIATLPGRGILGAAETAITRPLRAMGVPIPYLPESVYGGDRSSVTPYSDVLRREETPTGLPTAITRPETDMGGTAPKAAGPGVGAIVPAGIAGLGKVSEYKPRDFVSEYNKMLYGTETEPGLVARSAERQRKRDAFVGQAEAMVKGKPYEEYESSIRKDLENSGVDEERAKNLAIFKAGLAMMAGTSRHAFENIGKGALLGVEDYQKAAADIKKVRKENQMRLAYIDQARRAEDAGKRDRAIANYDKANEAEQRMDEFGARALMTGLGLNEEAAREKWKTEFSAAKSLQIEHMKQEGGIERMLARAALTGERGATTESQMSNIRGKIIEKLDSEGFELQKYRDLIGNPKLKQDQLQAIVKDPKNANLVRQVQQARREEIERRLMEQLGRYPTPTGQTAPQAAPQMSIVGYRPQ